MTYKKFALAFEFEQSKKVFDRNLILRVCPTNQSPPGEFTSSVVVAPGPEPSHQPSKVAGPLLVVRVMPIPRMPLPLFGNDVSFRISAIAYG